MSLGRNHFEATHRAAIDAREGRLRTRSVDLVERIRIRLRENAVFEIRHIEGHLVLAPKCWEHCLIRYANIVPWTRAAPRSELAVWTCHLAHRPRGR